MKIDVQNLGAIRRAVVDIKPLTVFIGKNNTGKTWLAYTIGAVFGQFWLDKYLSAYSQGKVAVQFPALEAAISEIRENGSSRLDLEEFVTENLNTLLNEIAREASIQMQDFMQTRLAVFENLKFSVDADEYKSDVLSKILISSSEGKVGVGSRSQRASLSGLKEKGSTDIYFYTETRGDSTPDLPERILRKFVAEGVFRAVHKALFPRVYLFPTERTTFITFPMPKERSNGHDADEEIEGDQRFLSYPVANFFETFLHIMQRGSLSKRKQRAESNSKIRRYLSLAQILERDVLEGRVDLSATEPEIAREVQYQQKGAPELEMPLVSSMVKELTPLVLYLRYEAEPGDLVIIDEPEMNLHPKAQVRIAEFLSMMVDAELSVLITTHSPYVVDHIGNLIKASEHDDKSEIKNKFMLKKVEAFISRNDVSIYRFDRGRAYQALDPEGFIDWGTFAKVSDYVSELYFEI